MNHYPAMQRYSRCNNIIVDGDEFTRGLAGLDWFPSATSSAQKRDFENGVFAVLEIISGTQSGRAVIADIARARSFALTILPYHPDAVNGVCNATAGATDLAGATLNGTTALDPNGHLPSPGQPRTIGTGQGSNSIVHFSPATWTAGSSCAAGPGTAGDEILLHEMVHGLRQMMGRSVRESVAGNPGMNNYEEFVAIVVSNVYRSERSLPGLRRDHAGFLPLLPPLNNPATFRTTFSTNLSNFDLEQPNLNAALRAVSTAFNPLL